MKIFKKEQIEKALNIPRLIEEIEKGFVAFSEKKVIVPPVGHMHFEHPPGDLHIKYGHVLGEKNFVVKIASIFSKNPEQGKPALNGMMLLFSQETGEPVALLQDEGYLTQVRTAIAGAIVAKHLAPKNVGCIGIIGTGVQARMQLEYLEGIVSTKNAMIWGRRKEAVEKLIEDPRLKRFIMRSAESLQELGKSCQLIISATSTTHPLLQASHVGKGTHITALGADRIGKQELDTALLDKADLLIADSREQSLHHGEFSHLSAPKQEKVIELGVFIKKKLKREEGDISIADLTGVAVQDIVIANHCYQNLTRA